MVKIYKPPSPLPVRLGECQEACRCRRLVSGAAGRDEDDRPAAPFDHLVTREIAGRWLHLLPCFVFNTLDRACANTWLPVHCPIKPASSVVGRTSGCPPTLLSFSEDWLRKPLYEQDSLAWHHVRQNLHCPGTASQKMASVKSLVAVVAALGAALLPAVAAQCANLTPVSQPQLAPGYSAKLILNQLSDPRSLQFDSLGNLLIVEQGGTGVRYVKLTDKGGVNVCVSSQKQLIPNGNVGHRRHTSHVVLTLLRLTDPRPAHSWNCSLGQWKNPIRVDGYGRAGLSL